MFADNGTPESVPTTPSIASQSPKTSTQASVEALARQFHALFAGMKRAHGAYGTPTEQRGDGKLKGKAFTKFEEVTDLLWQRHLQSDANGLGIIPLREDSTCVFGVVDLDVYNGEFNHGRMASRLAEMGLPLIPCRSKSGGCHLYLFCKEPVPAAKMRSRLRDIAARIGHGAAEVFPSHDRVSGEEASSYWVNAPYAGLAATTRYAIRPDGDSMSPEQFLAAAEAAKVSADWFSPVRPSSAPGSLPLAQDALPDGPPCLQHLMELGFPPGTWNAGMFNLGVYCRKAFPDQWKQQLVQLNAVNFPADKWPVSDLEGIFKSLSKKDYQYQCSGHPLKEHCNHGVCRTRKYGVGGSNSLPVIVGLSKLTTDPPVWSFEIEGVRISMSTEELHNPILFSLKCLKHSVVISPIGRGPWAEYLRALVPAATEIQVADDGSDLDDTSSRGVFMELLREFCVGRAQANSIEELGIGGRPFTFDGYTRFRLTDLMTFMVRRGVKNYTRLDAVTTLKAHGAKNRQERVGGQPTRIWIVKEFSREDVPVAVPAFVPDQGGF